MLYMKFADMAMGVCMRYSQNRADAEDLLQDTFVTVFRKLDQFSGSGELGGWIRKIAVNTSLMHFRKNKSKLLHIETEEAGIELESTHDTLAELAAQDLLRRIQALPDGYRMIFNLYGIEGFTHVEIAEQLNISVGTSKSQYSRARKLLIKNIEQEALTSLHGKAL